MKINCKLTKLDAKLLDLQIRIILKKIFLKILNLFKNLKKLKEDVNFITNFGRDVEYYTGIVFEVFSGNREIG